MNMAKDNGPQEKHEGGTGKTTHPECAEALQVFIPESERFPMVGTIRQLKLQLAANQALEEKRERHDRCGMWGALYVCMVFLFWACVIPFLCGGDFRFWVKAVTAAETLVVVGFKLFSGAFPRTTGFVGYAAAFQGLIVLFYM